MNRASSIRLTDLRSAGFTLLELLVVIGIMAVLMGCLGLYQLNHMPSGRIDVAARMICGAVSRAQMQARMSGSPTRLIVDFDPSSDGFLRTLFVCECPYDGRVGSGPSQWQAVGGALRLPSGVGIVPNDQTYLVGDWSGFQSAFFAGDSIMDFDPDGRGNRGFVFVQFSEGGLVDSLSESDYMEGDVDVSFSQVRIFVSAMRQLDVGAYAFENPLVGAAIEMTPQGGCFVRFK